MVTQRKYHVMTCNNLEVCSFTHISIYLWHTDFLFLEICTQLLHTLSDILLNRCSRTCTVTRSSPTAHNHPPPSSLRAFTLQSHHVTSSTLQHDLHLTFRDQLGVYSTLQSLGNSLYKQLSFMIHSVILHNSFRNLQCILRQKVQDILVHSIHKLLVFFNKSKQQKPVFRAYEYTIKL